MLYSKKELEEKQGIEISTLLQKEIRMLYTESELYLLAILQRVLVDTTSYRINAKGVQVAKHLYNSNGLIAYLQSGIETSLKIEVSTFLDDVFDYDYKSHIGLHLGVYENYFKIPNIQCAWSMLKSGKMVSYLYAYAEIIVENFLTGGLKTLCIEEADYTIAEELIDIYVLRDYGNRLYRLYGYIQELKSKPNVEWFAYCYYQKEQGKMMKEYSKEEKYKYMLNHYEQGEVVALYKRDIQLNVLDYFTPSVIREILPQGLKLTLLREQRTKEMQRICGDSLVQNYIDTMYNWRDMGVEGYTFENESHIIMPISDTDKVEVIENGKEINKNAIELIEQLLEEQGITYDKDLYNTKYKTDYRRQMKYLQGMRTIK